MITILGPTASGKTLHAVRLAREIGGEIISADSRQVYRHNDLCTGKDKGDYIISGEEIPRHLIDICEPTERYNLYRFVQDFQHAHDLITSRGRTPILCGGTGLYIEAIACGYYLPPPAQNHIIGISVSREERRRRISTRLAQRLDAGMVQEVRDLLYVHNVPVERMLAFGLEHRFITQHILGETTHEEMHNLLEIAIHQYAKRQMTWFRGMTERRGIAIEWIETPPP